MHLTQGPPFPCCKALVTTSAVRPSQTFGERLPVIPGPLGALLEWGAVSASQEELNYFPLSPFHLHPSLLWRFCAFLWLWQKRKFWWVKCWRSFLNVWKNPRFVCRFLLSCFLWLFFQVSCDSPIAEAVFVALITTPGNVLYRAVGFIYAHSWQTVHASLPAQILTDM